MYGRRPRYSQQAKTRFWQLLDAYKEALRTGNNVVRASLAIHCALGSVPKSYRRHVTKTFNTCGAVSA